MVLHADAGKDDDLSADVPRPSRPVPPAFRKGQDLSHCISVFARFADLKV
jgi:hypothetical protein